MNSRSKNLQVGTPKFRQYCIDNIKECDFKGYKNRSHFFERYLAGENFDQKSLLAIGYTHFIARNLDAYINNVHNDYYGNALKWE